MSDTKQIMKQMQLAEANSLVARDKRQKYETSIADFEGVAQGTWVGLTDKGSGLVEYRGKLYTTVPEGRYSIPAGTRVSLEFRKGSYISFW